MVNLKSGMKTNNLASILVYNALMNESSDVQDVVIKGALGLNPGKLWGFIASTPAIECVALNPLDYSAIALAPNFFGVEQCYDKEAAEQGIMCRLGKIPILQCPEIREGVMVGFGANKITAILELYERSGK